MRARCMILFICLSAAAQPGCDGAATKGGASPPSDLTNTVPTEASPSTSTPAAHDRAANDQPDNPQHRIGHVATLWAHAAYLRKLAAKERLGDVVLERVAKDRYQILPSAGSSAEALASIAEARLEPREQVPEAEPLEPRVMITTSQLNVRADPSARARLILGMPEHTMVIGLVGTIEGQESGPGGRGSWVYTLATLRNAGWAAGRFLQATKRCLPSTDGFQKMIGLEVDPSAESTLDDTALLIARGDDVLGLSFSATEDLSRVHLFTQSACILRSTGAEMTHYGRVLDVTRTGDELVLHFTTDPDGDEALGTTEWTPETGRRIRKRRPAPAASDRALLGWLSQASASVSDPCCDLCGFSGHDTVGSVVRLLRSARHSEEILCQDKDEGGVRHCTAKIREEPDREMTLVLSFEVTAAGEPKKETLTCSAIEPGG